MFPQQDINIDNIVENEKTTDVKIRKSFLFDFKKNEFEMKDGKIVELKDLESLKMWITKVLKTEKFRFRIYKRENKQLEYGVSILDLIVGYDYPKSFIESEIKREVTEAFLKHPLIESLSEWRLIKDNPVLKVCFRINLKDNRSFYKEVSLKDEY